MNFANVRNPFTFILVAMFAVVAFLPSPARCEPPSEIPWSMLQERDADGGLLPAYRHTMRRPLEYFGISIWSGPEEGGGYMGALADPAVVAAGGTNLFTESEVVETVDDYRQLAELGINFLPFTHTLFSPTDDARGFYTYDKVEKIIGYLDRQGIRASAYLGLANHPGFPLFTLAYGREDPTRQQRDTAGRPIYRGMPSMGVVNPALSWDHPDLAGGAIRSAAYHARDWKGFSNIPFWCLMGENLFAGKEADSSEVHRRHFAAWLKFRYKTPEAWSAAWGPEVPKAFAKTPSPKFVASETPTAAERDMAGEHIRLASALQKARAEGFDVARPRADLLGAAGHLTDGRRSKAAACLLHARRTLLVRLESTSKGDTFAASVRVASLAGELSESTEVELRLPDHRDARMKIEKVGPGQFKGELLRDERLAVYDYDTASYGPDPGPVAVEAEARAGACAGASPTVMWMP